MNTTQINEKLPPQNIEAEQSLLCCLLIDKDAIIKIADMVSENDFYKSAHKIIYETMKDLYARHEPIDILSLSNRLEEKSKLESVGGRTYLAHLSNFTATSAHVEHYGNIIQKKATLRRLIAASSEIMSLGYQEDGDIDKMLDSAEKKLFGVSQQYLKNDFSPVDSLLNDAFERIDDLHKQGGKLRGIPTGFADMDNLLSGFQKSDLIILAARPSVGKTTFALDIARQAALRGKISVGIFSLEMSKEQLIDRLLCSQANVNLFRMRGGKLSDKEDNNEFAKIGEAMGQLSEAQIFIDDSPNCSVMEIRSKARRLQMEKGLDMLLVDYLQLMEGRGQYKDNRVQEVSEISRGLKGIARELNIPVIALSQLSRAVEQSKPSIPKLSHLRDSGSIEQDADIVMFIYRKAADRNYNKEELPIDEKHKAEIYIAKHRNGPTGSVNLYFDENSVSFKNFDQISEENAYNF
ncbi:replicative DNA helicase [Candidatus Falkowbacteria bacterium RIFOXYB2_FULL_34_18]|uniref:Replicative DNA helicase n=1 Tax=Candidatus Falkowbacteria bacterium RIFOXYD2_FULL_34_120 TaxID=1798007 RepID=A0A1F5TN00_9BACT|nr:MAG: replicative DNA helicase [Candidatus Falkowbacteria bacterium RIFOXYC12_FULL_34_55]OGF28739.1 MAG: replicative DNA helicase [Candidatus Falkowbacteria bacterium RIFOXYB2_FULL_34_18]OGF38104.1 MAG: replicative DNA helicase [Candidatus Falkowbacteria bacterium RIFOXYC2_FULL_34_220]OGF38358.1 MAG: replicative DNA helicase [Candidatus Falkowbacteria bacterium RIFOXYD12_FULL_34_57]OGF40345.1 MAG: replicative DNA helicase [Candidatus Falkowbacteria bacterium RIFOXYD2_FULL_34_120]